MNYKRYLESFIIAVLVSGPLAFGLVEPWSLGMFQVLCFILFAGGILSIRRASSSFSQPSREAVLPTTLALAGIGVLQYLSPTTALGPAAIHPTTIFPHATGIATLQWLAYGALLFSAARAIDELESFQRLLWAIFIVGFVVALVGIAQQGQGNTAIYGLREVVNRDPFGPYYNRNHAASLMVMSFLIGCGLLASCTTRHRKNQEAAADLFARQGLILFLLVILFIGIVKTNSRGAILALFPAVLFGFLIEGVQSRRHRGILAAGLIFTVGVGTALFFLQPIWFGIVEGSLDLSPRYRISMYRSGFEILRDFPLFGVGLNSLEIIYPAYQERIIAGGFVHYLHSDWLELLVQTGLIGATCGIVGFVGQILLIKRRLLEQHSSENRWLFVGAISACFSFVLHAFGEFSFQIPANAAIVLTLAVCLGSIKSVSPANTASSHHSKSLLGLVLAAIGVVIFLASRPIVASIYSYRAYLRNDPITRISLWEKAYQWDSDPIYRNRIVKEYLELSTVHPSQIQRHIRSALMPSRELTDEQPLQPFNRKNHGFILWQLDRTRDARDYLKLSKKDG